MTTSSGCQVRPASCTELYTYLLVRIASAEVPVHRKALPYQKQEGSEWTDHIDAACARLKVPRNRIGYRKWSHSPTGAYHAMMGFRMLTSPKRKHTIKGVVANRMDIIILIFNCYLLDAVLAAANRTHTPTTYMSRLFSG